MTQPRLSTEDIVVRPASPGSTSEGDRDAGPPDLDRPGGTRSGLDRSDGGQADLERDGAASADAELAEQRAGTGGADAGRTGTERPDSGRRDDNAPLLDEGESAEFLRRWSEAQARFVDDPRGAVRDGDSLVAELVQAVAERFSQHKSGLEEQWSRGAEPGTEELRVAMQQYRSFFQRLLAT